DRGVFGLCRTCNPGGSDLQFMDVAGKPLYMRVAGMVAGARQARRAHSAQLRLVVGATYPAELASVRQQVGNVTPLLVPGIGAQGGDINATVKAGCNEAGTGMLINSSRAIIYAPGDDWRAAAAEAARQTRDAINAA